MGAPQGNSAWATVSRIILMEWQTFRTAPPAMRVLLVANAIYAPVLPIIEIFVAAFIMHSFQSPGMVVLCQLTIYAATPVGFLLNGLLLSRIPANRLYAAGMILTGTALFCLMLPGAASQTGSFLSAALLGLASGLFWANRGFLALAATCDPDRNYYYGVETCIGTISAVLVPLGVAFLFSRSAATEVSHHTTAGEYGILATVSLVFAALAAILIGRGLLSAPSPKRFLFFRSHPFWRRMLSLAVLKAVAQGYIVTAPAMLIFRFVGHEQTLGVIEALGGCIAALCLYCIGRICSPRHRVAILTVGQIAFLAGAAASAVLFNELGALIFMACLLAAKPLIDLAYYPIQFYATDVAASLEHRSDYSYIMSHECATFLGRFIGCGIFLGISMSFSDVAALRYALPIIALLQLPSIPLARQLDSAN